MPNQQVQNNNNYFFSVDGSFSETFLSFDSQEQAQLSEELLNSKIKQEIYGTSEGSPHYYEGSHVRSEFNAFTQTEEGKKTISQIQTELKICFQKLSEWSKIQDLEVTNYVEDEQTEQETTIRRGVDEELLLFYDRLIKEEFSDKVILFYTDGKKAIETLSLLIQDSRIDLAFRQNELINLAADGNLGLCADGCFSRFTTAADALKNYGDLAMLPLKKKFIRSLAEEIAKKPMIEWNNLNFLQFLCDVLDINFEAYEIHAENFLINTLLKELNLETLAIKDEIVDHQIIPYQDKVQDYISQRFIREFKTELTVKRFIQFIKNEYYQAKNIEFSSGEFKVPEEMDISEDLKVLGEDSGFGAAEVLSWDGDKGIVLKEENKLAITLTERLYNKNVLDPKHKRWHLKFNFLSESFKKNGFTFSPVTSEKSTRDYRIMPGNIELTWLKDKEGDRVLLLECLEFIPNCFDFLKSLVPSTQVESLFININDLTQFFTKLPTEQQTDALNWMKQNKVIFEGILLNEFFFDELNYSLESSVKLLYLSNYNKLFSKLSEEALPELIKQLDSQCIKLLLTENINLINEEDLGESNSVTDILDFIRYLRKGGFKKFISLEFGENFAEEEGGGYLKDIDFSSSDFEKFTSKVSLKNLNFKESKGAIEIFGDVSSTDFSRSRLIISIEGGVKNSFFQELTGEVIIHGDIQKIYAYNLKEMFELNGNAEETDLENFVGEMKINGNLDKVNLKNAHGESLTLNGEIKNSNLHGIQFKNIQVTGEISNSYLTSIDFRQVDFVDSKSNIDVIVNPDKVFKVKFKFSVQENTQPFFQDSQFSTTSLIQFLNLPSMDNFAGKNQVFSLLRGTRLSEIDFLNEHLRTALKRFYSIDFSGAYLQDTSFGDANLVNAILDGANLSHCDLSTAATTSISVKGAKIDNLQLRCDQLFHFYEQEHRDFSTLRLVGNLENIETFSLAGTKLSSQAFEHLVTQGFKNFKEVDLTAVPREVIRKYRNRDDLSFEKAMLPTEKRVLSLTDCLEGPRRKREIICLFDEDDVKEFSSENEQSGESQINSERFIDKLKSAPEDQRVQLIEFASQYSVVGTKQAEVKKLFQLGKWQEHFTKVSQVSNLISKGVIAKKALISFLKGDYEDTAIDLGFIGGSSLLGQFSKELEAMGEAFLFEGKNLLGNGFKAASPFFKRGTSAFMVYDLAQAVKELNSKDSAAFVRVVGDSIYIGFDIAEMGIEIAEVFEIFEGVSAITGPIGEVIGAVVFLGTDIYQAVQRVKQIDAMLHLTGSEKFREGVRAFLGMGIEDYLEELIEEKQFNEIAIKKVWDYLKQHPTIKNYIFPTQKQVCRKFRYKQADSYGGGFNGGGSRDGSYWRLAEVCDQTKTDLDNQIFLNKIQEITWSRAKPEVPESGDLLCFPPGTGGSSDRSYFCQNAIGISDPNHKAANYTLINVGEGVDRVQGFLTSPNTIVANNGDKHLIGGNQNDSFTLQGDVISGYIDGKGGVNTLDLGDFAANRGSLEINLGGRDPYIVHNGYGYKSIRVFNIQQVLARKEKPDRIHVGCDTSYIDGRGGYYNSYGQDIIVIGNNQKCHYQMQIKVSPYTFIKNQASQGNFSYLVTQGSGHAELHFEPLGKDITQHQISFNYTLSELNKIQYLPNNKIIFNLMPEAGSGFNVTLSRSNSTMISCIFTDQTEIKLGRQKTYTVQKTEKKPYEIVQQYPTIAERLHGSMTVHSHNQAIVIGYPFHHDVLQNDPLHPSYLVGNGGENIYKIVLRNNKKTPKITLFPPQANSKKIETLDLRAVIKEMEAHKNCTARLMIRKKGNNLHLLVTLKANKNCKLSKKSIRIILKDAAKKTSWIHQLNIITHQSFLEIKNKSNPYAWILTPKPLIFDETKKIIVLSAQDIEAHTHVMLSKLPGGLQFARTGEDLNDLIITSKRMTQARTVLIKEFYSVQGLDAHKLLTLSLHFGNETVTLTDVASRSLPSLATLQNNKKERVYKSLFGENISDQTIKTTQSWGLLMGIGVSIAFAIGYFSIKHLRARQFRPVRGDAATIAFLATTTLPAISAKPILPKTEMVVCHNQFLNDEQCAKSQTSMGTLIFCANNEIVLAWFKGEKGYDSAYALSSSTRYDTFELKAFGENLLMARGADQCQQIISLKTMDEASIGKMMALPVFQKLLKQPLEQYRRQNDPIERFQQQAQEIGLVYLSEQCLVHTTLGDAFRVLGLTPNWQQRDVGHWSSRVLRSLSARNLFSSGSISGVCLETALLHPGVQSALPEDKYRGKLVIRFITDLLQFGPSASSCIPSVFEFLFYQHPAWSYEKAMGLRGALVLLEVINDPSTWYLAVGLFVLPQIPNWLENIGIPITRYISHALQTLEKFLISYSLMLSMQEDPQRLAAKEIALQTADRRVNKGREQIAMLNSGVSFFGKSNASEVKANDANFFNSPI